MLRKNEPRSVTEQRKQVNGILDGILEGAHSGQESSDIDHGVLRRVKGIRGTTKNKKRLELLKAVLNDVVVDSLATDFGTSILQITYQMMEKEEHLKSG